MSPEKEKRDVPASGAAERMSYTTRDGESVNAAVRNVGDVVAEGLWPDLPKIKCGGPEAEGELYNGDPFTVMDLVPDMVSDNGIYLVARCQSESGDEFTTAIGAVVAYEKLVKLFKFGQLPIRGSIKQMQPKGKGRPYVDFV